MKLTITAIVLLTGLLLLNFSVTAQDYKILRVENVRDGWNKLKLGNNHNSFWNPKVDVTAGGNTHLDIELRVSEGTPDMSRIQIRPNGYSGNPVNFADYLPADFSFGFDWYTISIPLADFDPGINFTQLNLLQLPYSNMAGTFVMELRSVAFTGGTSPYTWFGDGKRDNIHDGFGYSGQMIAAIEKEFYFDYYYDYPGNMITSPIEYATSEYLWRTSGCQQFRAACAYGNMSLPVTTNLAPVSDCSFVPGNYVASAVLPDYGMYSEEFSIPAQPPLSASYDIFPTEEENTKEIRVYMEGGIGSYFMQWPTPIAASDSAENYIWQTNFDQVYEYYSDDISTDLFGNSYVTKSFKLYKFDTDGNQVWRLDAINGTFLAVYVDNSGVVYASGRAKKQFSLNGKYIGNDKETGFIARISPAGDVEWIRNAPDRYPKDITTDGRGNVYYTENEDIPRLTCLSVNGVHKWTKSGTVGSVYWAGVTTDPDGNVYAGMTMEEGSVFDGIDITGTPLNNRWNTTDGNSQNAGGIIFKTDSSGVIQWLEPLYYSHTIRSMAVGQNGVLYIASQYDYPLNYSFYTTSFLEGRNTHDGTGIFVEELSQGAFYTVNDVEVDPAGMPHVSDNFGSMRKFTPTGALLNEFLISQVSYSFVPDISFDGLGYIYILNDDDGGTLKKLAPASTLVTKFTHNSYEDFTLQDARGQAVEFTINFTTTSITGINANLDNSAYEISWQPALSEHNGYEVYEQAGESLNLIARVDKETETFTHYTTTDIPEKPEYIIRVLTDNGENQSQPHSPAVLSAKAETGGKVDLIWQPYTGYEDPSYTLYRGADEFSMEPVSKLKAEQLSYSDKLPASGDYMYRLEVTGKDGSSMSNTVSVSSDASEHTVTLWPNPATDMINCRWEGRSQSNTLQLSDVQGRIMAEYSNIDPNGYQLQRRALPAGIYLLTFEDAAGKTTERIVFK